jgi:uncharacterized protein YpmB
MKRIITFIIIILALVAAIFFGYQSIKSSPTDSQTAIAGPSRILPYGTDLNFDSVQKYNKNNNLFQYPVVTPGEIGPNFGEILK